MDDLIAAALAAGEAQQQPSGHEDDYQQDQDASTENQCGVNDYDSVARNPCRSCAYFFLRSTS